MNHHMRDEISALAARSKSMNDDISGRDVLPGG
jgi:hypothetical protein